MKVYFVRHANADWPDWSGRENERPLTPKGRRQSFRIAKFLRKVGADPKLILTSPLTRAAQTAEAIADRLCIEVREEPSLAKGFNLAALRAIITRTKGADVMVVGHEPSLSAVISQLAGGRVKLAKAAIARVDLDSPESDGTLVWLLPPKAARRS